MKKFLKLAFVVIVTMIIIFSVSLLKKASIINELNKLAEETSEDYKNEFSMEIINSSFEFGDFLTIESIVKGDNAIVIEKISSKETGEQIINTNYYIDNEKINTIERNESKIYTISELDSEQENFPNLKIYKGNLKDLSSIDIKESRLEYIDVYIISDKEKVCWVNAKNGLILKEIDLLNNITHEYKYKLGNIKEDIVIPDLTDYERLYLLKEY